MSAVAPAASAAQPTVSNTPNLWNRFQTKWDTVVNWTNTNGIDSKDWLTVGNVEGTLKKIAKVFLALIPLILNGVAGCFGAAFAWVRKGLCEEVKTAAPAQAPPAGVNQQ